MDATNNIATDLFYKVRSRFAGLKLGAETGEITINPEQARFFDFDYTEGETPMGHVSISLAEPNSMKVYFSNGITEGMDDGQKTSWYGFLKELRQFAKRRLLSFDTRDITKDNLDKRDYEFLSQNAKPKPQMNKIQTPVGESLMSENLMSESSMYGSKTVSYQKLMDTRLIIKHSQAVMDDTQPGARTRNISGLFVENQDGERFKYPFIHLAGARAMQRHVANGGLPYDELGESITKMSEEIAQLKSFGNYVVRNDLMNSDTNSIIAIILVLQQTDNATNEIDLHNCLVDDLELIKDEIGMYSHWMGTKYTNNNILKYKLQDKEFFSPILNTGDMYIFSASRIHKLNNLIQNNNRIVLATFGCVYNKKIILYQ